MDYAKAIRIARALVDIPQRELAKRVSVDASLISMFESGKRTPSLETLQKIADALSLPFHLFILLATDPKGRKAITSEEINQLAIGLAKLLLLGDADEHLNVTGRRDRKIRHSQPKPPRADSRNQRRKIV